MRGVVDRSQRGRRPAFALCRRHNGLSANAKVGVPKPRVSPSARWARAGIRWSRLFRVSQASCPGPPPNPGSIRGQRRKEYAGPSHPKSPGVRCVQRTFFEQLWQRMHAPHAAPSCLAQPAPRARNIPARPQCRESTQSQGPSPTANASGRKPASARVHMAR